MKYLKVLKAPCWTKALIMSVYTSEQFALNHQYSLNRLDK